MIIYEIQKIVGQVTTKLMREQGFKRISSRDYEADLIISDIKEKSFKFKKDKTCSHYDPEVVETFDFYGSYAEGELFIKFKVVINKDDEPAIVTYNVYIDKEGQVTCKSDEYENFVYDISPNTLKFNLEEKKEMTFAEASEKYGVAASTLRHSQRNGRFEDGDTRKSGRTWLVTKSAMERLYGEEKEMKKFEIHNGEVMAKTNKDVVELALESGLFEIKSQEKEGLDEWGQLSYHDAPYALVMRDEKEVGGYLECWGLDREMTLKEALEDFDYLEEQRIIDILEACNIEYEIERDQS